MPTQPEIPGYTLISPIAEGGMAVVWRARQEQLDRVVAVKIMDKKAATDEREVERFLYEARAAASLIHPNIVQVIDAGERPDFLYYVMEYVPGPTVGDLVDEQGALPEERVLEIALEVCEGLEYAWRDHKVVHCDIKPDNLLLHRNGRTKIADLGLARVLGGEAVAIEDDMTIGTPNYFPPEQALVEEPFDCRTDMYALAASMYHMATGTLPFGELDPDEVASQQVHGQIPAPCKVNPALGKPFCGLIEKMMAKNSADRYEDWPEIIAEIQAIRERASLESPLSPDIKSTVEHTPQPLSGKAKRKAIRRRGAHPVLSDGKVVRKGRHAVKIGTARSSIRTPVEDPPNIWPVVVGLGAVVGLLYAYTLFLG